MLGFPLGATQASAAEVSVDTYISEIYSWYGGAVSKSDIRAAGEKRASQANMSLFKTLDKIVKEARSARPTHSCASSAAKHKLTKARKVGDIFVSTSGIAWFGHAGIYTKTNTVVHHPGMNKRSKSVKAASIKVGCGSVIDSVSTSSAIRKKAAKLAVKSYLNRQYNWMFPFFNKKFLPLKRVNCSQLVWLTYYRSAKVDLDGNGGWAVYPWDLDRSSKTKTYKVFK